MRTNLLNNLSNVLKKGTSMNLLPKMDRKWIGNDSRMDRQSLGKIFRYVAVLFMVFMVGIGNAWGV